VPLVALHLWGVRPHLVPVALGRMGLDRLLVRRPTPAAPSAPSARPTFTKLLGTGDGRTFTLRDADPGHWGLLSCWAEGAAGPSRNSSTTLTGLESSATVRGWERIAHERLRVVLRPVVSRGTWSGREPFGRPVPRKVGGPVASITRARLRPRLARTFWRAVPPVSADLRDVDGLRLAVGIGEAPIGLQGTFSLWDDARSLDEFAYRRAAHSDIVRRTAETGWYAEELFARFEVLSVDGTFAGQAP